MTCTMSQANLAWQLMMGADDKIVIGTLNRDAWKSTELAQKEAQLLSGALGILKQTEELMSFAAANHLIS